MVKLRIQVGVEVKVGRRKGMGGSREIKREGQKAGEPWRGKSNLHQEILNPTRRTCHHSILQIAFPISSVVDNLQLSWAS